MHPVVLYRGWDFCTGLALGAHKLRLMLGESVVLVDHVVGRQGHGAAPVVLSAKVFKLLSSACGAKTRVCNRGLPIFVVPADHVVGRQGHGAPPFIEPSAWSQVDCVTCVVIPVNLVKHLSQVPIVRRESQLNHVSQLPVMYS